MTRIFGLFILFAGICLGQSQLQSLACTATALPPIMRGEGIAERVGDIVLNCTGGAPNAAITGNFSIFLNVNITNRVAAGNVTDVVFTVDNGSGPVPVSIPGTLTGPADLVYNGLSFKLSPTGTAVLRVANIRAAAIQLMLAPNTAIQAFLGFNAGSLVSLNTYLLTVGTVTRSFYAGTASKLVCSAAGSAVPSGLSFAGFLASGAVFASTRVTEGIADAFEPRSGWANFNADAGERILVQYGNFPAGAQLFVPNVVAGSDAVQPTGGGDFGVPASGGQYAPSANGSLLLALVPNADANGAGGSPVYTPGPLGSGTVGFDALTQLTFNNGNAYAVYEVVDANPNVIESAQFPTFLGLAPAIITNPIITTENIFMAPVSNVQTASASAPIPRFAPVAAPNDCSIVGDCSANYFPRMYVDTTPIAYTAQAGSSYQVAYSRVLNQGGGVLNWAASIQYQTGSGWLTVSPPSGTNNATIRMDATPGTLAPGTYQATVIVSGGPVGGNQSIPVTLVVTAAPVPAVQPPVITSVVNAASFAAGPVAPGSLATIQGIKLAGNNVAVTFDGLPATMLFGNATQLNVLVPPALGTKTSSQVVVTVDGNASAAMTVSLASMAPAIFPNAVLNQDFSANNSTNPAAGGSVLQIFATGLSGSGAITAQIADRVIDLPYYAGAAPGLSGVQQMDLIVPQDLPSMTTNVYVCGNIGDQKVCSPSAPVSIVQASQ